MHHRAHHIQHYHHNNYRNSEKFRRQKETSLFLCWVFQNQVEKFKSSQQKLTFWGWFCWEDEKRNSVILCQFNCWVVCLLKKKRKTYERKKMKKKRLKQKKIVVLSCFKFCWDSFLILWKTPSFSPHCCWNYYLLLYILLREKKVGGATI